MEESSGDSSDDFIDEVADRRMKPHGKEDRISSLPDAVIHHILSFLPSTKEAIRTSILSKRWRNKWTQVPVLIFIAPHPRLCDQYYRYIGTTLVLHESPKLKKFHLDYDYHAKPDHQFTSKIRFAVRKCVEELLLICECTSESFLLPGFLFENAFLVHLEMVNCYFLPKWRVNWPSLKSLMIGCSALSKYDCSRGIGNVVSGSPLLESLELRGYMRDHITIVSKSLVTLTFINVEVSGAIKISCPNLVEFNVVDKDCFSSTFPDQMIENALSGSPCIHSLNLSSCNGFDKLVVASESLEVLSLVYVDTTVIEVSCPNLAKFDFYPLWDEIFQAVKVSCPSSTCTTLDYEYPPEDHNSVMELLEQFQHVNKLTIGSSFFKMISDLDVKICLSLPLLNSIYMTLNVGGYFGLAIPGITYALRSPKLQTLVIKLDPKFHQETLDKDLEDLIISRLNYWNSNESTGFTCLMSNLKTVKITGLCEKDNKCKLALEFIEFLLKKARVLEKIILLLEKPGPFFVNKVSQELLSFPRYSPHAIVRLLST